MFPVRAHGDAEFVDEEVGIGVVAGLAYGRGHVWWLACHRRRGGRWIECTVEYSTAGAMTANDASSRAALYFGLLTPFLLAINSTAAVEPPPHTLVVLLLPFLLRHCGKTRLSDITMSHSTAVVVPSLTDIQQPPSRRASAETLVRPREKRKE